MKKPYFTGYFPFFAIILFSLSFGIYTETNMLGLLKQIGIYQGMLEFFSETGMNLALLIMLVMLFFMLFAALKLISDTIIEISLLFFSKDVVKSKLQDISLGSVIFVIGAAVSLVSVASLLGLVAVFLGTAFISFLYFVYKISPDLTLTGLIGLIFFHTFIWAILILIVALSAIKLYNSIAGSLPM